MFIIWCWGDYRRKYRRGMGEMGEKMGDNGVDVNKRRYRNGLLMGILWNGLGWMVVMG